MAGGVAFRPEDHELIDLFLRPKLAGQPLAAGLIHDVDVYYAASNQLIAGRTAPPGSKVYLSPRESPRSSSTMTTTALSESGSCKKRKAEEEHPEAPAPCSARRQTTDEEDGHHHRAEAEAPPCSSVPLHTDEEEVNELFKMLKRLERDGVQISSEFNENYLLSFDGVDMTALQSFDSHELDNLSGGKPGSPPPSPADPEPEGEGEGDAAITSLLIQVSARLQELQLRQELQ